MGFIKRQAIWIQLLIIGVITIVIMLTIVLLIYHQVEEITIERNVKYTQEIISQLKHDISSNFNAYSKLLINIGYDKTVQSFMYSKEAGIHVPYGREVSSLVDILTSTEKNIVDVVVLGKYNHHTTIRGYSIYAYQEEKNVPQDKGLHISPFTQVMVNYKPRNCILMSTHINSIDPDNFYGERIGFVSIIIDMTSIINNKIKFPELSGTKIYILDKSNSILTNEDNTIVREELEFMKKIDPNDSEPQRLIIGNQKSIVQVVDFPEIQGKIISIFLEKELFSELEEVQLNSAFITGIALLILGFLSFIVIQNIIKPLRTMMEYMSTVSNGNLKNLKKRINLEGSAEITTLSSEFNNMMDTIDTLTYQLVSTSTQLYKNEISKKESELIFLQSQINPHFLYNTLESIKGIAAARNVPEIWDMTRALSQIFRYSIKGSNEVTFDEELNIIKSYIKIQQIRFSNRFLVKYSINDSTLDCKIPKMILQPIVENAIYHGLEPKEGIGILSISGFFNNDSDLMIVIKDNGMGIDEETLTKLNEELQDDDKNSILSTKTRIGISNVNNRIKILYGLGFGLFIHSELDKGTEVTIKLPKRRFKNV